MFGFVWQLGYSQLYIMCVLFVYFGDLFLHFHELDSQEADFFFFFLKNWKKQRLRYPDFQSLVWVRFQKRQILHLP